MREFRGEGGREGGKGGDDFRVEWKASSEREVSVGRKEGREHRGGEAGGRREGRGGENASGGGGGGGGGPTTAREKKPDDARGGGGMQDAGEMRETWGSRSFLKGGGGHGGHGAGEEGEVGEYKDRGGEGARPEEGKKKREERGGGSNSNAAEREERGREKSERRGGGGSDLPGGHVSSGEKQAHSREKQQQHREEKAAAERDKEKESHGGNKAKEKAGKGDKDESVAGKEKAAGGGKESKTETHRERDSDGGLYHRRKEATAGDQDEKEQNPPSDRVEKRGGGSVPAEREVGAVGSNSGDDNKAGEMERAAEGKEHQPQQQLHEKGKAEVGEVVEEKGKRKARELDKGGGGGDEAHHNAEGEDYEKDVVSSYGMQRRRMLRPRGHYQSSSTREGRPRFRKDPESYPVRAASAAAHGAAGATANESSILVYRAGEGLQEELRRIRREFDDKSGKLPATEQSGSAVLATPPTIEVRVPAELATTVNRQVQGSQLWGTDLYTDDSDLVAVLMHTGYYAPAAPSSQPAISELRATIRVFPAQERYFSTLRNSLRSRAWGTASGCAYSIDGCSLFKRDGGKVQLEPRLTFTPAFAPTLAPAMSERTVTTRAVSMNAYRTQRFVQEVTIMYNLCNEPWLKYTMNIVADRGLKKSQYTSARLKKSDVLYVETHSHRYELSYEDPTKAGVPHVSDSKGASEKGKEKAEAPDKGADRGADKGGPALVGTSKEIVAVDKANNHHNGLAIGDKYRWARCKWPLPLQSMRAKGIPLSLDYVKVLENGMGWEEVQWSPAGVCVRGKEYPLSRAHFIPMQD